MKYRCKMHENILFFEPSDGTESDKYMFQNSEQEREEVRTLLMNQENSYWIQANKDAAEELGLESEIDEENTIYVWVPLTWDAIIALWGEEPTIKKKIKTFEDIVNQKQLQIKDWCNIKIVNGIDIDLGLKGEDDKPLGTLHYSLSERKQTDMRDLMSMIAAGAPVVTWRDDSRVSHMVYTAEQFTALYRAATEFIFRCRFHSDGLEELLFSYTEDQVEDVEAIEWNTELPKEIQDKIDSMLETMGIN